MSRESPSNRRLASNRKARHNYLILEKLEAGIVLVGTEVKSARAGKIQLKDSHVEVVEGEAYLVGAHISPYTHGNRQNHDPERRRKLLLKRREIERLMGRITIQGQTCVPLEVYLKGNRIKVEIALAKGKKLYDKRQAEKVKLIDKEAREALQNHRR